MTQLPPRPRPHLPTDTADSLAFFNGTPSPQLPEYIGIDRPRLYQRNRLERLRHHYSDPALEQFVRHVLGDDSVVSAYFFPRMAMGVQDYATIAPQANTPAWIPLDVALSAARMAQSSALVQPHERELLHLAAFVYPCQRRAGRPSGFGGPPGSSQDHSDLGAAPACRPFRKGAPMSHRPGNRRVMPPLKRSTHYMLVAAVMAILAIPGTLLFLAVQLWWANDEVVSTQPIGAFVHMSAPGGITGRVVIQTERGFLPLRQAVAVATGFDHGAWARSKRPLLR